MGMIETKHRQDFFDDVLNLASQYGFSREDVADIFGNEFVTQTQQLLLDVAMKEYPVGTVYTPAHLPFTKMTVISKGFFYFSGDVYEKDADQDDQYSRIVYDKKHGWAIKH